MDLDTEVNHLEQRLQALEEQVQSFDDRFTRFNRKMDERDRDQNALWRVLKDLTVNPEKSPATDELQVSVFCDRCGFFTSLHVTLTHQYNTVPDHTCYCASQVPRARGTYTSWKYHPGTWTTQFS